MIVRIILSCGIRKIGNQFDNLSETENKDKIR